MIKKLSFGTMFLAGLSMLVLTSCEKDETPATKPAINGLELGTGNNHIAYIGSDMHVEAEIIAEGKINTVAVEIHREDGAGDEIEAEYTDYAGLKNASFHKHIDIPAETAAGEYHFHLTVTDMEGQTTTVEEDISIEVSTDAEKPVLSIANAPTQNQEFNAGQSISISGRVSDNVGVGGMMVALIKNPAEVTEENVILMYLNYFQDKTEVEFNATIDAGAEYDKNITPALIQGANAWQSGAYYILVRAWDTIGNTIDSQLYPININL